MQLRRHRAEGGHLRGCRTPLTAEPVPKHARVARLRLAAAAGVTASRSAPVRRAQNRRHCVILSRSRGVVPNTTYYWRPMGCGASTKAARGDARTYTATPDSHQSGPCETYTARICDPCRRHMRVFSSKCLSRNNTSLTGGTAACCRAYHQVLTHELAPTPSGNQREYMQYMPGVRFSLPQLDFPPRHVLKFHGGCLGRLAGSPDGGRGAAADRGQDEAGEEYRI